MKLNFNFNFNCCYNCQAHPSPSFHCVAELAFCRIFKKRWRFVEFHASFPPLRQVVPPLLSPPLGGGPFPPLSKTCRGNPVFFLLSSQYFVSPGTRIRLLGLPYLICLLLFCCFSFQFSCKITSCLLLFRCFSS